MISKNRKIYLVRHGETEWTLSGRHTGLTNLSLTPHGEEQVKKLGKWLENLNFEKVYVSPLKRALETCKLCGFENKSQIVPDLVEWNYGEYEGLTHKEINEENPGWNLFIQGAPGGESVGDIGARANRLLTKFASIEGDLLLFSSAHILRVLAARWLGLPPSEGRLFLLSPASLSILGYERKTPVIHLWNENIP